MPCGLSVLHRTYPDHYLVELAGVEPASEIPTYYLNYNKNNDLLFKTVGWYYSVFVHFTRF
ncbi:hypothetical protein EIL40_25360 [Escherichia coli]|nr:hypothetical protein [Escherichia coli]EFO3753666.1 hypothetical protein [Escherichia coli]MBW1545507.1 hypothetical protein [Escherichia coli]OTE91848.1 hypothetical protein B1K96_16705 [Escherichia coli]OWS79211.1 hypothetical protein B7C52_17515 [Escherichia coli]